MFAIKLFEQGSRHEVSLRFYWSLTVGLIAVAVFFAWRDERRKWERLGGLAPLPFTPGEMVAPYRDRTTTHAGRIVKAYKKGSI